MAVRFPREFSKIPINGEKQSGAKSLEVTGGICLPGEDLSGPVPDLLIGPGSEDPCTIIAHVKLPEQ